MWPGVDLELWRERLFRLCWTQHGGSGLRCDVGTALALPVGDRDWLLERQTEERRAEAKAIDEAGRG